VVSVAASDMRTINNGGAGERLDAFMTVCAAPLRCSRSSHSGEDARFVARSAQLPYQRTLLPVPLQRQSRRAHAGGHGHGGVVGR
jgi:hypothetical protein